MYKTIKELADEMSISRQAVHQALDKVVDKEKLNKKGNAFILNSREQKLIFDFYKFSPEETSSSESQSSFKQTSSNLTSTLQQQNDFLMRELENKNKQINELHILLLKEKENTKLIGTKDNKNEKEKTKKKRWYDIFNKGGLE